MKLKTFFLIDALGVLSFFTLLYAVAGFLSESLQSFQNIVDHTLIALPLFIVAVIILNRFIKEFMEREVKKNAAGIDTSSH